VCPLLAYFHLSSLLACVPACLQEIEEDENEEEAEDDVQEDALAQGASKGSKKAAAAAKGGKKKAAVKGAWVGAVAKTLAGDKFYSKAKVGWGVGIVRCGRSGVVIGWQYSRCLLVVKAICVLPVGWGGTPGWELPLPLPRLHVCLPLTLTALAAALCRLPTPRLLWATRCCWWLRRTRRWHPWPWCRPCGRPLAVRCPLPACTLGCLTHLCM
jgi:hypothetical protein